MKDYSINFKYFTEKLRRQLSEPLPGVEAHERMNTQSPLRRLVTPNDKTRKSAVLILFYPHQNEVHVPLILRPAYDGVHASQMAFAGGRHEHTDENLTRTALREAQEEIGIKATDVEVIGQLTELFIPPSNFFVLPVVGFIDYRPDFYPDPREVERVFEVPMRTLADENIKGTTTVTTKGYDFDAPFYGIEGHKIWGATALMIAELLALIDKIEN